MTTTADISRPGLPPGRTNPPARLDLRRSSSRLTIIAAERLGRRSHASFNGSPARINEHDRTVTIVNPLIAPAAWFSPTRRSTTITLAAEEPWEITSTGGLAHLRLDMSAGELRSLEISGGVSEARLCLPQPHGVVHLRIGGGARELQILRPVGTAACLRIRGGAHRLALDDELFGAIGGTVALATPGASNIADRYEIEIAGGASHLTVSSPACPGKTFRAACRG
jgi:hypothetical protein